MKVLIIEDESLAAERLVYLLMQYDSTIQIMDCLDSVEEVVNYLPLNPSIDLIFADIQLSDGLSFEIFQKIQIQIPIIFTTAFDQYAIQAFQVNSIDYLLKPVSAKDLHRAMEKLQSFSSSMQNLNGIDFRKIAEGLRNLQKNYKSRFLVRFGDHLQFKNAADIAYFYADGKEVYMIMHDKKKYLIEYTLEDLSDQLDPEVFYRLNRKFITRIEAVKDIRTYSNSRLKVWLSPELGMDIVVSREKVPMFKAWLNR